MKNWPAILLSGLLATIILIELYIFSSITVLVERIENVESKLATYLYPDNPRELTSEADTSDPEILMDDLYKKVNALVENHSHEASVNQRYAAPAREKQIQEMNSRFTPQARGEELLQRFDNLAFSSADSRNEASIESVFSGLNVSALELVDAECRGALCKISYEFTSQIPTVESQIAEMELNYELAKLNQGKIVANTVSSPNSKRKMMFIEVEE